MSAQPTSPADTLWLSASVIAFRAADHGKWSLYERLKSFYQSSFPDASSYEYEAAMRRLAKMAGV